jgi:hypothetical protein
VRTREKEQIRLALAWERYYAGQGPPPPDRPMRPDYASHSTCDVCWDGYWLAWWHRLFAKHDPRACHDPLERLL